MIKKKINGCDGGVGFGVGGEWMRVVSGVSQGEGVLEPSFSFY